MKDDSPTPTAFDKWKFTETMSSLVEMNGLSADTEF